NEEGDPIEEEELKEISFDIVDDVQDHHLISPSAVIVEVLSENYHQANIEGIAIANENGHFYIPTEIALESKVFSNWASDASVKKWVFDAKRAVVALGWRDILLDGIEFDLQMASYLLDPSLSSDEISEIV